MQFVENILLNIQLEIYNFLISLFCLGTLVQIMNVISYSSFIYST